MAYRRDKPEEVFKKYFPEAAIPYCLGLWKQYNFRFRITRPRNSKLGDYRFHLIHKTHTITVNSDLNPYAFLVTYLHEVAHMQVNLDHGPKKTEPHGMEWKQAFRDIAKPMLQNGIFPARVLAALQKYLSNPRASSCADPHLVHALAEFDDDSGEVLLRSVPLGGRFSLHGKTYKKEELRRTRFLCREVLTGRMYLVPALAKVRMAS